MGCNSCDSSLLTEKGGSLSLTQRQEQYDRNSFQDTVLGVRDAILASRIWLKPTMPLGISRALEKGL